MKHFLLLALLLPVHDADEPNADWFNSLTQPGSGISCCGPADCRPVTIRYIDGRIEAWIDRKTFPMSWDAPEAGGWVSIPERAISDRHDNPTGKPIACWFRGAIVCFIPAEMT